MKQSETRFKEDVFKVLKELKPYIYYFKVQQVALRGIPDIIICCSGEFVAWELKVPPNKLVQGSLQQKHLAEIAEADGFASVVTPENIETHMKYLWLRIEARYGDGATKRSRAAKLPTNKIYRTRRT